MGRHLERPLARRPPGAEIVNFSRSYDSQSEKGYRSSCRSHSSARCSHPAIPISWKVRKPPATRVRNPRSASRSRPP